MVLSIAWYECCQGYRYNNPSFYCLSCIDIKEGHFYKSLLNSQDASIIELYTSHSWSMHVCGWLPWYGCSVYTGLDFLIRSS